MTLLPERFVTGTPPPSAQAALRPQSTPTGHALPHARARRILYRAARTTRRASGHWARILRRRRRGCKVGRSSSSTEDEVPECCSETALSSSPHSGRIRGAPAGKNGAEMTRGMAVWVGPRHRRTMPAWRLKRFPGPRSRRGTPPRARVPGRLLGGASRQAAGAQGDEPAAARDEALADPNLRQPFAKAAAEMSERDVDGSRLQAVSNRKSTILRSSRPNSTPIR